MAGRTTLIIAHRLSTISLADRVAVVEGGRVIAEGTHAELLATEPRYAEILAQSDVDADAGRRRRPTAIAAERERAPTPTSARARSTPTSRDMRDLDDEVRALDELDADEPSRGVSLMGSSGGGGGTITGGAPMGGAVGGSPATPATGCRSRASRRRCGQGVEKLLADEPDLTDDRAGRRRTARSPTA